MVVFAAYPCSPASNKQAEVSTVAGIPASEPMCPSPCCPEPCTKIGAVLLCVCVPLWQVGKGSKAYEEAKAALKRWAHFQLGWAQVSLNYCYLHLVSFTIAPHPTAARLIPLGAFHASTLLGTVDPATPVKGGTPVCVVAKTLFAWTANPLQVVYTREGPVKAAQRAAT
eukprot:scaffold298063_cov23-Tisochrysis_lutea.AAC.1